MATARRITIYRAPDGWRYRVQSGNWKIIDASEEGKSARSRVRTMLEKRYPGVEIVIDEGAA